MGLTHIEASIANPAKPKRSVRLSLLVDSGAVYSVVPARLLRKLGIKPHSRRTFTLADGTKITCRVGDVLFRLDESSRSLAGSLRREGRQHSARQYLCGGPRLHPGPT